MESRYSKWKKVLLDKGLEVNVSKTKAFCTGRATLRLQACRCPCSVCGKRVGKNSIMCTICKCWIHKRCSTIQGYIAKVTNLTCRRYQGLLNKNTEERTTLDGDDIEIVNGFTYLGDVLSAEGGVQEAVTSTVRSGWKKFKDICNVLCKKASH